MEESLKDIPVTRNIFDEMFYNSPLPIYTCDKDGFITSFNKRASELWGSIPALGTDKWYNLSKFYFLSGLEMKPEETPIGITLKTGKALESIELLLETNGSDLYNMLAFSEPIFNNLGELTGAYNSFVDITKQKKEESKHAILSAIITSSSDAIISKDLQGIITSWNIGAEKIFGYKESEVIGKSINILIPDRLINEEKNIIDNIKAGLRIEHFQTIRKSKTGKEIPISLAVSPIINPQGVIIGASKIARDISELLEKENSLKRYAERLETLNSIGNTILEKMDILSIMKRVMDATNKIVRADFGVFYYYNTDVQGKLLQQVNITGLPESFFEEFEKMDNSNPTSPFFMGKGKYRINNLAAEDIVDKNGILRKFQTHFQMRSFLSVPIMGKEMVVGRFFFGSKETDLFSNEDEFLIISIASQTSVALENATLFEAVFELSNKKDEFIALASHELKTPLATLKGYLQILQSREKDALNLRFIDKTLKQTNRLNLLVGDLFDISKIETGKLQLEYEYFDPKILFTDVIETLSYSDNAHKILLEAPEKCEAVHADKQRMEQVIINLLTNAIKYSPVTENIIARIEYDEENLIVKIMDKGIGVSKENSLHIFTRFFRVKNSNHITGLGLGLYLTREIINRHRGNIFVEPNGDKGSTFVFTIPIYNLNENNG